MRISDWSSDVCSSDLVAQDGEPVPLQVGALSTALALDENGGQLVLQRLEVEHPMLHAELQGEVVLQELQDSWTLQASLRPSAIGVGADSPLCANRYVSRLPVNSGAKSNKIGRESCRERVWQ